MPNQQNILGQPVGALVPSLGCAKVSSLMKPCEGSLCSIEPLVPDRDSITSIRS
jgi:hypothetical protein